MNTALLAECKPSAQASQVTPDPSWLVELWLAWQAVATIL